MAVLSGPTFFASVSAFKHLIIKVLRGPIESGQYASREYQALLKHYGMKCSMSRKADCWDSAVVESFFGTLKTELIYRSL